MDGNVVALTLHLESFTYVGLFFILFICGLGAPIPEEIPLVIGGYLAYHGFTQYPQTVLTGLIGVMVGDLTLFYIGNRWGTELVNHHRLNWIFTKKRMTKAQAYLRIYGKRTIFIVRFLSGIRSGVYLTVGALKMNLFDFLKMDLLAALLSVPLLISIGYYFGEHIDKGVSSVSRSSHIILAVAITAIAILTLVYLLKKHGKLNSKS